MTDEGDDGTFHGHRIPPGEEPAWIDRPENVTWIFRAVVLAWALSIVASFLPYVKHPHFPFEALGFFQALYGLVCAIGLVLGARRLREWLARSEDYYDQGSE